MSDAKDEAALNSANPWREEITNTINGDNHFRSSDWYRLRDELDDLYAMRKRLNDLEVFVRNLLWDAHPECCGEPSIGATYMGQNEKVCCGCPNSDTLNDAQIVMSLRAKFPEAA